MANVTYSQSSPYYSTDVYKKTFLDVMVNRGIPPDTNDVYWQITVTYNYRPDLLAFDLYGDANLWWVFALRNPNVIKDPVFDMKPGAKIFLPKKETITAAIGL